MPEMITAAKRRKWLEGYAYISPWLIGFLAFTIAPVFYSLYLSFTNWDFLSKPVFVGWGNYVEIFSQDPKFGKILWNTVYYTIGSVPLRLVFALVLAIMLTKPYKGANGFRVLFYLPGIISGVAVSAVWARMFDPFFGAFNDILMRIGLPRAMWISDVNLAMPSIILMNLMYIGQPMVIFIAGLRDIPYQLYEVALLDGANPWKRFRNVTLPMLSPILFFNLVMQFIASFQVFTSIYIMTSGGPADATMVYMMYLYNTAFQWMRMGYGSALAWVLFCIILGLTLLVFKTSGWVYFEGKEDNNKW